MRSPRLPFRARSKASRGFSLIELLAVVTILMIMAASVATNIDFMIPGARLEACARILSTDISYARSSAIAQGLPYRIEYDLDHDKYRIATPFRGGDGGIATNDEERAYTTWKDFPEDVKIQRIICGLRRDAKDWSWQEVNKGIYRVEIRPNGNTVEHVIHLTRQDTKHDFFLAVQALTGFVQFYGGDWQPDIVGDGDFQ